MNQCSTNKDPQHFKAFTVTSEDQWCRRAEHLLPCDSIVNLTSVVANVWALHFGDVKTPRLLRDESTTVLLDKVWVFIEDPSKCQLWNAKENNLTEQLWSTVTCSKHDWFRIVRNIDLCGWYCWTARNITYCGLKMLAVSLGRDNMAIVIAICAEVMRNLRKGSETK